MASYKRPKAEFDSQVEYYIGEVCEAREVQNINKEVLEPGASLDDYVYGDHEEDLTIQEAWELSNV